MEKPISRPMHGFTDYSYIPAVVAAPEIVGFKEEKAATTLCRVLSGNILLSSLLTKAEWGAIRVIPYKTHLILDVSVGLFALSAPWLFNFSQNTKARNTFITMGIFGILAGTLSRPEEMVDFE